MSRGRAKETRERAQGSGDLWRLLGASPEREEDFGTWFCELAQELLCRGVLWAGPVAHDLVELEFYYCGPRHLDPFAHRHPLQRSRGHWYFHRAGTSGSYRGRSYKGLDLTFGGADAFGGILIRALRTSAGELVEGPSLVVDHLLRVSGGQTVAQLDGLTIPVGPLSTNEVEAEPSSAGTGGACVRLTLVPRNEAPRIVSTPRVGLTLKRMASEPRMPDFIGRRYRFVVADPRLRKGRVHTVLGLQLDGDSIEAIAAATGVSQRIAEGYVRRFEQGRAASERGLRDGWVRGTRLGIGDLCELFGVVTRA